MPSSSRESRRARAGAPEPSSETIQAAAATAFLRRPFQTAHVLAISLGHFIHDIYTSFLAPLLPRLIEKMSLSLTEASLLSAFLQLPSLLNPLIGMLADRVSLRRVAILAPLVSGVAMSLIGIAPSYAALAILLFSAGLSVAVWHVPMPVTIARVSGDRVGRGMSIYMLGGELGRSVGPLVAVTAASWWTLEGIWRTAPLGAAASLMLLWRMRSIPPRHRIHSGRTPPGTWRSIRRVMLPLSGVLLARWAINAPLGTFLPTLLTGEGKSLLYGGVALSIYQLAGAAGALASGTLSDRLGRRRVIILVLIATPLVMLLFLAARGWFALAVLALLGLLSVSLNPVMLAMVQEQAGGLPATANGLFMATSFTIRPLVLLLVGLIADRWGLRTAFTTGALLGFVGIAFALLLPRSHPGEP